MNNLFEKNTTLGGKPPLNQNFVQNKSGIKLWPFISDN